MGHVLSILLLGLLCLPTYALALSCLIRWNPSVAGNVAIAGYRLYSRMTQDTPYDVDLPTEDILLDQLADQNAPEWEVTCEAGQYWVATAYDMENVSSVFSNEARVPDAPPPPPPGDMTAPVVVIKSPTSNSTWKTHKSTMPMAGTAQDAVGVTAVRWKTSAGRSGTAVGTTSWSMKVPLPIGITVVTVEALDAAGNVGSDAVTITRK